MLKNLLCVFILSILLINNANSKNFYSYVIGDKIENEVNLDKKITIDLSPGEWVILEKTNWKYNAFSGKVLELAKLDKVNNSIALAVDLYGFKLLCLAIETKKKISKNSVIKKLKTNLPTYCLPKKIVFYKKFPLNINDKINKKKIEEDILQSQKK